MHLLIQLLDKLGPVFQADLENLAIVNLRNADKVEVGMGEKVSVWEIFDELLSVVSRDYKYVHYPGNSRLGERQRNLSRKVQGFE